ncbi:hypothetical protein AB0O67_07620 [Streptomyces sp. NPDC086077]|uniref:hypothetical protein n=1 Tax=Streptomyces sp. NPDC086077 TaxID=3154862 RepID=UPI00342BD5E7
MQRATSQLEQLSAAARRSTMVLVFLRTAQGGSACLDTQLPSVTEAVRAVLGQPATV